MEPGEDIVEAAKRETLEETGMDIEVTTMLLVEAAGKKNYTEKLVTELLYSEIALPK